MEATLTAASTPAIEAAARVCAEVHGLRPLTSSGGSAAVTAASDVARQFSTDVSSISDAQRGALFAELGDAAGPFVLALYIVDMVPRLFATLEALFGAGAWDQPLVPDAEPAADLWASIDAFIRAVPRLTALDPVTTELVRLRGATHHDCRLCKSVRSRPALLAAGSDTIFDVPFATTADGLDASQAAALALVDAMVWTPGRIAADVLVDVHRHFSDHQCVEIALDVVRNATNKIAVAFRADAPHVTAGYEIYDIGENGDMVYGLTLAG